MTTANSFAVGQAGEGPIKRLRQDDARASEAARRLGDQRFIGEPARPVAACAAPGVPLTANPQRSVPAT
jgi:hypothetical protein